MKLERVGFRAILIGLTFLALPAFAQRGQQQPGKSIGKVHVEGNLIVMELDEGVLGTEVLFNLEGRTLRFVPEAGGYRVHNDELVWDAQFGEQLSNPQVSLKNFAFPFSGKAFNSFSVGNTGSIAFAAEPPVDGAAAAAAFGRGGRGGAGGGGAGRAGRGGGVTLDRFAQLGRAAARRWSTRRLRSAPSPSSACRAWLRQGTGRSRRRHLGPHGALRRHSGLHLDSDREPLPGCAHEVGRDRSVVSEDDGARWNRRHLSASPRSQQGRRHRTRKGEAGRRAVPRRLSGVPLSAVAPGAGPDVFGTQGTGRPLRFPRLLLGLPRR